MFTNLYFHGVTGRIIAWFKSYLTNRKQYIDYGNRKENSDLLKISCGIPQ